MDALVAKIVKQVVARRLATSLTFTGPHDALKADLVTSGRDAVYFAAEIPNPKHNPDEYDMIRGVKDWWHKPTKTVAYLIVDLDTTQGNYSVGQAWTDEGFRRQGLIRRLYDMAWDYARSKGKGFGSGWVQSPLMAQYWEGLVDQGKAESYTDPYNTTGKGWRRMQASDHRMRHRPSEGGPPAHDLVSQDVELPMPDDILSRPERYTGSRGLVREFWSSILKAQGNPNAPITIYRALPATVPAVFENGDWITLSLGYARKHIESNVPGGQIISAVVPARTVVYAGDDLMEWGYWGSTVKARRTAARVAARREVDCHLDSYGLDDLIRTGSGKLYHGTNRQFKRFDMAYIRHDLINRFYKAPGIFLTPRRATAEQYADAARNAMVPAVVVADLVRTNRGAGEVLTRLVGEGRDAWDGLRAEAKAAFPDATYFEAMEMMTGGVDQNTLMDLAKHIEGTRYTDAPEENSLFEATNSLFALWGSAAPTSTPVWVFDALDRLGLDSSEYRPKVYTVEVSGLDRVLVTRSKAEAGKAKAKGYDAVVFCGSDLVDGVPEVVVFDPSNVRVTKVDLVERSEPDDSDPIYYNAD